MTATKYCEDCKWFIPGYKWVRFRKYISASSSRCKHPDVDPPENSIIRQPKGSSCDYARHFSGACGPQGKLWERADRLFGADPHGE